jgi:hypothetical protein
MTERAGLEGGEDWLAILVGGGWVKNDVHNWSRERIIWIIYMCNYTVISVQTVFKALMREAK